MSSRIRAAGLRRRKAAISAPVTGAREAVSPPGDGRPSPLPETELLDTAERLRVAFELLKHGVFDWNVQSGRVLFATPGYPPGQPFPAYQTVSADTWFDSTHHDDIAMAGSAVDRALRGETDGFTTFYRRRHGDTWLYVRSMGRVVARSPDGRALRVIGTYTDLTGPVIEERGRHAREARVRHARFRAALSELAAELSHELNQPLAALCSNTQAVMRLLPLGTTVSQEAHHALARSVLLAERAAEIVKAMRRLIQGQAVVDECFDLKALVMEVHDLLGAEAARADVVLEADVSGRPALVTADRTQIEQVIVNLVQNGIEAIMLAHPPSRRVAVRVKSGRSTVRVEVEDTGPGVDPAVRERIFDAYFTTKPQGTGLGLRLSRSFAEAHGGKVYCKPRKPGRGAVFILELPASRRVPQASPRPHPIPSSERGNAR